MDLSSVTSVFRAACSFENSEIPNWSYTLMFLILYYGIQISPDKSTITRQLDPTSRQEKSLSTRALFCINSHINQTIFILCAVKKKKIPFTWWWFWCNCGRIAPKVYLYIHLFIVRMCK